MSAEYNLIRSNRKTVAIRVAKDMRVEVRAPLKIPKTAIDRFVISKQDWIRKQLSVCAARAESRASFELRYGGRVLLRGSEYPIVARDGKRAGFDGACFYLPPALSSREIKRALVQVYRATAKDVLIGRVAEWAKKMGSAPSSVKISGAKTRWGSCSGGNGLNFSWRLIMADSEAIDYVVVHELAHIREHNHSNRFWAIVASVLPDHKERSARLTGLRNRLAGEDWG